MNVNYPLEWFDNLIMSKLNAKKHDAIQLMQPHCEEIKERADIESLKIQAQIKTQVFTTSNVEEIEIVVRQYHSSLIQLYDYALYQNHPVFSSCVLKNANKHVLSKIDELISFIESRFWKYLSPEDRAPQSFLSITQTEIKEKIPLLKIKLERLSHDSRVVDIVMHRLQRFSSGQKQPFNITFKNIQYKKELVKNLCELDAGNQGGAGYSALDKLLIYLNYNSKSYIRNLMQTIAKAVDKAESVQGKINQLSLSFKEFKQILHKPNVKLNPKFHDLHQVMNNWFTQEIAYLEKRLQLAGEDMSEKSIPSRAVDGVNSAKLKVTCVLSIDQMALIIRAMDELRVLEAKSMSEVFKTLVPHLSTPHKKELSHGSMRSKSYTAEVRDKQIAVETLQKIINRVKEY